MYSVAVGASVRGALSYWLASSMSGGAFSWVRFLTKSVRGAMVPSGLGRQGPQRRRLPARVTPALKKELVERDTSPNKARYHYTPGNLGTRGVKRGQQ